MDRDVPSVPQLSFFPETLAPETVISIIFTLIFIWWFIYTLVVAFHWLTFGRSSWIAVPALGLHLAISSWLLFYMTSGIH